MQFKLLNGFLFCMKEGAHLEIVGINRKYDV